MSQHFITRCRVCDVVIAQCRCPDRNKVVRYALCDACQAKGET